MPKKRVIEAQFNVALNTTGSFPLQMVAPVDLARIDGILVPTESAGSGAGPLTAQLTNFNAQALTESGAVVAAVQEADPDVYVALPSTELDLAAYQPFFLELGGTTITGTNLWTLLLYMTTQGD